MSLIEVYANIEDRCLCLEIPDSGTLKDLKEEFDEICKDDVALTRRRERYAPLFSILKSGTEKKEIPRRFKFKGGENVYIGWTLLNFELDENLNSPKGKTDNSVSQKSPTYGQEEKGNCELFNKSDSLECTSFSKDLYGGQDSPLSDDLFDFEPSDLSVFGTASLHPAKQISSERLKKQNPALEPQRQNPAGRLPPKKVTGKPNKSSPKINPINSEPLRRSTRLTRQMVVDDGTDKVDALDNEFGHNSRLDADADGIYQLTLTGQGHNSSTFTDCLSSSSIEENDRPKSQNVAETTLNQNSGVEPPKKQIAERPHQSPNVEIPVSSESTRRSTRVKKGIVYDDGTQEVDSPDSVSGSLELDANSSITSQLTLPVNGESDNSFTLATDESSSSESSSNKENDPPSTNGKKKRPKKRSEYRKPQKKILLFNETINEATKLPSFSVALRNNLKNNKVHMNHVLKEIREHILQKRKDTYLKKSEMKLLCSAIVKEYPILSDPNSYQKGFKILKRSIQKSFSSIRYYNAEKEENPQPPAARKNPLEIPFQEQPSTSGAGSIVELQSGCFQNERRTKWLIQQTYKERNCEFVLSETKLDIIKQYPHFKDARMLVYEYTLLKELESKVQEKNSQELIEILSSFLEIPLITIDSNLEVLTLIQEKLIPKALLSQNLRRAITFKDTTQVDQNTLAQLNTVQAPCLVSTVATGRQGRRVLTSSVLMMHDEVLSTMKDPQVHEVLQQLLAAYFVFELKYPRAYDSFLRLLESYLHGTLSSHTKKSLPKQEYTALVRSLEPFVKSVRK